MSWITDLALSGLLLLVPLAGWGPVTLWQARAGIASDQATRWALASALGLAWLQLGGMVLLFTSSLSAAAALAWLGAGLAPGAWALMRAHGRGLLSLPRADVPLLLGALALSPYLLMATVPPWYQDDMTYHLSLPRYFAAAGGYAVPDDNIFANLPLGWHSVLALFFSLGEAPDRFPPFNPRLLGAWTAGAAALAATGLARSMGAGRYGFLAGLLLLLCPTMLHYGPSGYVESYLLLLSALALTGVLRTMKGEGAWLPVAGLAAGLAASVKFTGLVGVALMAVILVLDGLGRARTWPVIRRAAAFTALAALAGSFFYVKNMMERGNPFFPSAGEFFGGEGWDAWRSWAWSRLLEAYGYGREPADWLLLPWRLATSRHLFSHFEGSMGPIPMLGLLASPALAWRFRNSPTLRPLLGGAAFALGFTAFWALSTQQLRFHLPALPAMVALAAVGAASLAEARRLPRLTVPTAIIAFSLAWSAGPLGSLWARQHTGPWLSGRMDRHQVLSALLPDTWPVMAAVEEEVPPDGLIWLVWTRSKTYYLTRPHRLDCIFEAWRFEALLDHNPDPSEARAAIIESGATHVLVNHRFFLAGENAELTPGRTERLRESFVALLDTGALVPRRRSGPVVLYAVAPQERTTPP